MRVRDRWLLLAVFIMAVLIVLAILGSGRGNHSGVTISFAGYTNLPGAKARSAVFVIHNERPKARYIRNTWFELEWLEGNNAHWREVPFRTGKVRGSVLGKSYSLVVEEPSEGGRWRALVQVRPMSLRARLRDYGWKQGPFPLRWFLQLESHNVLNEPITYVTNSSQWLTNSPASQKQP